MSYLLDANALIALGWSAHEHHERMIRWFKTHARQGWATTALTQSAFLRIISRPAFSGGIAGMNEIAELLLRNMAHPGHRFLPLDFGVEQVLGCCTGGLRGHRQITDGWLLTLAISNEVKLVTFDGGIARLLATESERERYLHTPA